MSDWKGFGRCLIWVIYAETLLRREQSQEALRHVMSTEIIHVLITLPGCLRMSSAEPLSSLQLLDSVIQSESDTE